MNKDKYFVYNAGYNCWMHRTPLKCFINPILRFIQFWTDKVKNERNPKFIQVYDDYMNGKIE